MSQTRGVAYERSRVRGRARRWRRGRGGGGADEAGRGGAGVPRSVSVYNAIQTSWSDVSPCGPTREQVMVKGGPTLHGPTR